MFADINIEPWSWGSIALMVIAGGWIIPATAGAIAKNWRRARESEHVAALKQSMIERGMSVDDIERVINAGMPGSRGADDNHPCAAHERQSLS
jgi:hypothetical protein